MVELKINFCLHKKKPVIHRFYSLKTKIKLLLGIYIILGNYCNGKINLFLPSLWKHSKKNSSLFLRRFEYALTHEVLHSIIKKETNNLAPSKGEEEMVNQLLN